MSAPRIDYVGIRRIRDLIATPDRWTKNVSARDSQGRPTSATHKSAVCFCLMGARDAVLLEDAETSGFMRSMLPAGHRGWFTTFNDDPDTTHADVLAYLDRVIATEPPVVSRFQRLIARIKAVFS